MNLIKLKAALDGAQTCSVLSSHIIDMAEKIPDLPNDVTAIDGMNLLNKWIREAPYVGYFEPSRDEIVKDAKITSDKTTRLLKDLDRMARNYIMFGLIPLMNEDVIDGFDELKKIEKAAQKLKSLLPEKDSALYTILTMAEQAQSHSTVHLDEATNAAAQYFNNLNLMLDGLINLRPRIPQTAMGQFMKLGVKSPKGNLALRVWTEQAYALWTGVLKRGFVYDGKTGTNGRKRFTEFTYEALTIIHPAMKYASVEHRVRAMLERYSKLNVPLPPKNIS